MCGINGFSFPDEKTLKRMNAAIRHRGPDDSGTYVDKSVSLGHLRLAIIDLSPAGHQPMWYEHGELRKGKLGKTDANRSSKRTLGIVFNGEIYNFQELREQLIGIGYSFKSKSDTEVIMASYLAWGPDCVKRFNGMWAFCLYDKDRQLLFCSRDRAGKKPFYYYHQDGKFIFSSELKGILEHKGLRISRKDNISPDAVSFYFSLGFIPAPFTIYKNVSKLEARHSLIYNLSTKKIERIWEYYDIPAYNPTHDKKTLIKEGRELLKDAVRLRMIADVPVGAFLSGGLDSSTVVGEMANFTKLENLHTFSIGFEGKFDETPYINIVKDHFKTRHHHLLFTEKDLHELFPKFPEIYDEPFWDYSGFPTYCVSGLARKEVTVCLSGDGGDEIFGGYMTHVTGHRMDLLRKIPRPLRKLGSKLPAKENLGSFANFYLLTKGLQASLAAPEEFYARTLEDVGIKPAVYKRWTTEKLAYCLKKSHGNMGEALRLFDLLYGTIPDLFLVKVDRASMAHALEVRAPLLDYRLMEYAQRIPATWKADSFKTKKLMREIIKDIVPESIVKRGKQGFTPPFEEWVLQPRYAPLITEGVALLRTLDPELHAFYETHVIKQENKLYTNYRIRLLLFSAWWKRWIG